MGQKLFCVPKAEKKIMQYLGLTIDLLTRWDFSKKQHLTKVTQTHISETFPKRLQLINSCKQFKTSFEDIFFCLL